MGNNLQHAFFIKQHHTAAQPSTQLLYNVIICRKWQAWMLRPARLSRLVYSCWYCMPEYIFDEEYERQAEGRRLTRPQLYPLGVKIKCIPVCSLNIFQRDRTREGRQWTALSSVLFVLIRNYSPEDYNLTSVRKTQTEEDTAQTDNICRHRKKVSRKQTSIKIRF